MRYSITEEKIKSYISSYKNNHNDKDLKALKASTKVALIEQGKPRQAHKLDEKITLDLPKEKQFSMCIEFASQVFDNLREFLIQ
jgi:hypothetical protein